MKPRKGLGGNSILTDDFLKDIEIITDYKKEYF